MQVLKEKGKKYLMNKKLLIGLAVVLLTVCYLTITVAVAQESPKESTISAYTDYVPDDLSWGDIYSFDEAAFNATYKHLGDKTTLNYENNKSSTSSSTTSDSNFPAYVSSITFNDHAAPEKAGMTAHDSFTQFRNNISMGTVTAPIDSNVSIPVATTTSTGVYSVVPSSTGTYVVYVYSPSGTPSNVKYSLINSCSDANGYSGSPSTALSFSSVDGAEGWYSSSVSISRLGWYALMPSVQSGNQNASNQKSDEGTGPFSAGTLNRTTLSTTYYYYNKWSYTQANFDTVLCLSFPSTVKLGPITKASGTFTLNCDETKGTVTVKNIFGADVGHSYSGVHMPLFFSATPVGTNSFTGVEECSVNPVEGTENLYRYDFEGTITLTARFEQLVALPKVSVSGTTLDAYFNPDAATNFPIGTDTPFTFTADFSQAESGSTLSYAVTGSTTGINTSGSLTASNNSFSLVASFDNLTVTFTAVCGETEKTMTYTITGSGQPVAQIGSTDYYTLEDALKASVSGNTVVLLRDYTMYTGSKPRLDWATNNNGYTVKSGVKLLIPYNDAHTFIDNSSVKTNYIQYQKTETVVRYCTLTLPQGKMMYVNGGEVSVASRVYCMSTGQNGAYGSIDMKAGSNITFNSGSSLYAFGYITGTGTVTVNSGAKVYESMFVADYPGSASSTNSLTNAGVFPFAKFTVRNVEAPMTLNHGATEQVYFNMYGTSTVVGYKSTFVNFVGNSTSYLFSTSTGSSLTKSFVRNTSSVTDISNARQKVVINGNSSINSMSISISGYSVNTSSLNGVVIPYNFDITIGSGTTTLAENLIFCKGSTGTLNSGATLAINSSKNLYVLDASDDKHPNLPSGLADAKLDINGTISVSGAFYTSANNANVMSSGKTGKVIFNTAAGTATSLKVKSSNTAATAVTIKPAVLQNSSGTTDTAGAVKDNQFIYCSTHNQWEKTPVKVTFDANGGTGTMTAQSIIRATATALTANTFTRDGYTFSGWNTKADGTGTSYADKASVTLHEKADLTLYAKWQAKPQYTITWTWQTASGAASDTTTVYQGDVPTHAEAPAYSTVSKNYTFKAWSPAPTAATANKTYTATYTESVRQYPVTFDMQGHGTAPASQNVDYNTTATRPASPTVGDEVSEASGKYRFDGWYTDTSFNTAFDFNTKITGNTTVYAKWTGFYTVTFDKQGKGNDVSPIENVQSGSTISAPAYPEASVTTIDVGSDKYRFDGWYKEAACTNAWNFGTDTVTGATTIYAKWTQVNTVVFENSVVNTEEEEYVADNETVTIPDDPDGKKTAQYTYTFQGWSTGGENGTVDSSLTAGTVVVVNDDTTYTAIYEQTVNQYQYTFKNGDTVLKSDTVDYGTDPTYDGEEPAKVDITGQYTYSFDGWDYEYFCIDEDEEIPAGATKVKVEEGGASTGSGYKRELAASGAELGGAASTGLWKISGHADVIDDLPEVHGEMTVTAAYTESLTEYAITWKDGDGNTLKTDQVAYGSTPSYIGAAPTKTATAQYTYTFNNTWSPTITPVTGAATYTAQFDSTVNTYTVTWVVDGETSTATYSYGDTPSYDSTPTKDKDTQYAYTFSGWSPAITAVTGDVTYTAQFSTTSLAIKHSITLDGEIGVSFYIPTVSVDDPVNSTVALSWGPATGPDHGEATFSISDLTDSNANDTNVVFHGTDNGASVGLTPLAKAKINGGYYQFTAFVAAKQMADDITLNIYDTDHQAVLTDTYCVADYCYEVINGAKDCADDTAIENSDIYQRMYAADNTMTAEKFKDLLELCKALLTYGSKAQVQFSYNADADGLADKDLTDYTYTAATAADFESFYTAEYASGADSMTYYGSSMQLEAETTYTVWLRYTDQSYEPPAATATVKGQSVTVDTVKVSGSYDAYYVRYNIMNLPANLLTEDITVSYNNAETAKYNAKTYFYLALVSGNATLENTVTSLYNYNQAAVTYFGSGS